MARSKVKSRSDHDLAHLQPQIMSLLSMNYTLLHLTVFKDIEWTGIYRLLWQSQRSNQGHSIMLLHVKGQIKVTP